MLSRVGLMEVDAKSAPIPSSLMQGVFDTVCSELGIANLKHKSTLLKLSVPADLDLAATVFDVVCANWLRGDASANRNRSRQNWRWSLQPQISSHNRSPEVVLERAIARACGKSTRDDWANQIPVASGLIAGASDGRRAIDLARRTSPNACELIELKIASDTPLYAAIELLGYASIWLLARKNPPIPAPDLLKAGTIDLRVLAPSAFYRPYGLARLENSLLRGVRSLGKREGASMSFGFHVLPAALSAGSLPGDVELLELMNQCGPLHDTL